MIEIRKKYPVVIDGKFDLLYKRNKNLFIYTRTLDHQKLLVISSFAQKEVSCPIKNFEGYKLILSNYKEHKDTFMPFECRIYLKEE